MKTLMGFVAGLFLAGGIAFFVVGRKSEPVPPSIPAPVAPASQVVETPKPADPNPPAAAPVEEPRRPEPAVRRKPAPVKQASKPPASSTPAPTEAAPKPSEPAPQENTVARNAEPPAPAPEPPPYNPPPPPPAPKPNTVTVPAGTILNIRLQDTLASDKNQVGDSFAAVLDKPLVVDGFVIADRGARVEGRVANSQAAGRVKGVSSLALEVLSVRTADGQVMKVATDTWEKQGETSTKSDVAKVGAAAGIGAAIGAIAGGGKGAAIGAAIGGGAGTGGVLATRGKPVRLPVETRIPLRMREPVTITEKLQ